MTAHRIFAAGIAGLALLATAACGTEGADQVDQDLVADANAADPALTSALEDQIMVDPGLAQQSNANSARPAAAPLQAPMPATGGKPAPVPGGLMKAPAPQSGPVAGKLTLGELAQTQAAKRGPGGGDCMSAFQYGAGWATRLPAAFPLYPDAQVVEAAGSDAGACRMRIVSYVSPTPATTLVDFYYTQAVRSGYSAEHRKSGAEHTLGGVQQGGNGAFAVMIRPAGSKGTEVDLVVNSGR